MAFCPNCGSFVDGGMSSCTKCGAPVAASAPAPAPPPAFGNVPSPVGFQPGYGGQLPDVQPMAIILAAASWVVCGPLASVPAVIMARNDLRGIREGRISPSGQQQSQLAFWIAAINVAFYGLFIVFFILMFLIMGVGFFAASKSHPRSFPVPVVSTHPEFAAKTYDDLERDVERMMATHPETERKLWREAKDDLRVKRKARGTGMMPEVKSLSALMATAASEEALWSALAELERKAAMESGHAVLPRVRPAEAPE
ncbi:MAG: zinc ribbon domain-containing protein [Planctomycetes bacterium]|nr:zinc ribbon domain-containing protein [Planctomycetota bacterium]